MFFFYCTYDGGCLLFDNVHLYSIADHLRQIFYGNKKITLLKKNNTNNPQKCLI